VITSQLPVASWHDVIGEPTLRRDPGSHCPQCLPARARRPVDAQAQSQRGDRRAGLARGDDRIRRRARTLRSANAPDGAVTLVAIDRNRWSRSVGTSGRDRRNAHSAYYTDRGSHYFFTPKGGGKVDETQPTQVGRALSQLGIRAKISSAGPALAHLLLLESLRICAIPAGPKTSRRIPSIVFSRKLQNGEPRWGERGSL
jgi:hypothetical protein